MNILRVQNINSWLVSPDRDLKSTLHASLRFREKNYYHNPAYKKGKWDGFKNFFNERSGIFLTGLLPEVQQVLNKLNKPYTISDEREEGVQWLHKEINETFLKVLRVKEYANDKQKEELLSSEIVKSLVERALKKGVEFESEGEWVDAYAHCFYWLSALYPDNQEYKDQIRANTDDVIERGGFGTPTMFVDGDSMFFGNDRLVLVEEELKRSI